jgi:hypothetical protein
MARHKLTGMTRGHCRHALSLALEAARGVSGVFAGLDRDLAHAKGETKAMALVAALPAQGGRAMSAAKR